MPEGSVRSSEDQGGRNTSDPTTATTDILRREIAHLSDRIDLKIEGVLSSLNARLTAIDKATEVFSENLVRVPTAVDRAVAELRTLTDEKFARMAVKFDAVQTQMTERDVKVSEVAVSTGRAIDAALSAAEKATSKQAESFSEAADKQAAAFTKSIDQQAALYQTETRALRDICTALDRRLTVIEGQALGQSEAKGEQHISSGFIISVIMAVVGLASLLLAYSHSVGR